MCGCASARHSELRYQGRRATDEVHRVIVLYRGAGLPPAIRTLSRNHVDKVRRRSPRADARSCRRLG